ncbi:MAG: sulfite exporter TauE/SafE family protein [Vibrio sp.]
MDYNFSTNMLIMVIFLIAGTIKGVVGLGLPPVVLGLLTASVGIHSAMVMVALPAFITNLYQAMTGNNAKIIIKEHWFFFLSATLFVGVGCCAALLIDHQSMSVLLGISLIIYTVAGISNFRFNIQQRWQKFFGVIMGILNGIFTGLTGSSAVPGVFYLQSSGLPKEQLVQAMGILFTFSSAGLSIGLYVQSKLTVTWGALSLMALVPAILGMYIGSKIRQGLSIKTFQKVFFLSLLTLGIFIVANNVSL